MHEKENIRKRLLELFRQVDDDNSGTITLDEFERRFEEESVKNLFESLDLGTSDAWTLFQILDMDCNRYIDVTEFVNSCIRHRGSAKCVDVVGLTKQVRKARDELSKMSRAQERILKELKTTQKTFLVWQICKPVSHLKKIPSSRRKPTLTSPWRTGKKCRTCDERSCHWSRWPDDEMPWHIFDGKNWGREAWECWELNFSEKRIPKEELGCKKR